MHARLVRIGECVRLRSLSSNQQFEGRKAGRGEGPAILATTWPKLWSLAFGVPVGRDRAPRGEFFATLEVPLPRLPLSEHQFQEAPAGVTIRVRVRCQGQRTIIVAHRPLVL